MKLGIVGWRGMVGQVLMERMSAEGDFDFFETSFFSTSNAGGSHPFKHLKNANPVLQDAYNTKELALMDVIVTCQGGDYTKAVFKNLRDLGFKGYWIDAASAIRMEENSTIILDPVNMSVIKSALLAGKKDFIGGNCTVSLMLMALGGLFTQGHIEWMTSQTYQAASGGGARHMNELLQQMKYITDRVLGAEANLSDKILSVEKNVTTLMGHNDFPKENFGQSLACNLIPWIDSDLGNGQSREEWKASAEGNKILGTKSIIPIDGTCVRVSSMRCHAQALTIKLKSAIPLDEIEGLLAAHNPWVMVVPNNKTESIKYLTPEFASGKLTVPVGRLRKLEMGDHYLNAFTVGDQLLWGAAEPLRRMLKILIDFKS
ncbi:MAG: aspartate-semialdehyde dehydrogenase [Bacteriovoracaceae bacterium]|nr:aspartate-semialdehyde dehydrogenase [Bacteriovoracaceae bacterium]